MNASLGGQPCHLFHPRPSLPLLWCLALLNNFSLKVRLFGAAVKCGECHRHHP